MVRGSSSARIGCDLEHRQLYTRDDIRKYDESMPRSALLSPDDPYALSQKTSLLWSLSLRYATLSSGPPHAELRGPQRQVFVAGVQIAGPPVTGLRRWGAKS